MPIHTDVHNTGIFKRWHIKATGFDMAALFEQFANHHYYVFNN